MKIFGQIVRTVVETIKLPVALTKDAVTGGGATEDRERTYTEEQLDAIKEAASEDGE